MRRIKAKEMAAVKADLLLKQNGICPLCDEPFKESKDICLDHDHVTGYIRALLCRNCNAMEGKIFNCARRAKRLLNVIEWLERLLEYLKLHQLCQTGLLHHNHRTDDEKRLKRNKKRKKRRDKVKASKAQISGDPVVTIKKKKK